MDNVTMFKVFVSNQDEAKRFYVERLGFEVGEDQMLGDYRWLTVRAPGNRDFAINLEIARTSEETALVGRQAASQPLFGISTRNCRETYAELKGRGVVFEGEPQTMPYGTGVLLRDLYGNKIYLNEDPV